MAGLLVFCYIFKCLLAIFKKLVEQNKMKDTQIFSKYGLKLQNDMQVYANNRSLLEYDSRRAERMCTKYW